MHVRAQHLCLLLLALCAAVDGSKEGNAKVGDAQVLHAVSAKSEPPLMLHKKLGEQAAVVPCTCGIFLSGQFKKGSRAAPKGEPVITEELDVHFAHNALGRRQCANKCIENIIKYLPKSSDIICSLMDRDCHKEKAFLFTKNYDEKWINSNMSAGREFCCKDNQAYKCPIL